MVFQELVKKTCSGQRVAESHAKAIWVDVCRTRGHLYMELGKEKSIFGAKNRMCKAQKPSTTTLVCPKWFWMLGKSFRQLKIIIIIIRQGLI